MKGMGVASAAARGSKAMAVAGVFAGACSSVPSSPSCFCSPASSLDGDAFSALTASETSV